MNVLRTELQNNEAVHGWVSVGGVIQLSRVPCSNNNNLMARTHYEVESGKNNIPERPPSNLFARAHSEEHQGPCEIHFGSVHSIITDSSSCPLSPSNGKLLAFCRRRGQKKGMRWTPTTTEAVEVVSHINTVKYTEIVSAGCIGQGSC